MERLKQRAGLVGLAAFLVLDVALVGLAVASTRQPVAAGGVSADSQTSGSAVTPGASGTSSSTTSSSGSSTTATTTGSTSPVEVVPLTVALTAVNTTTALRFSTGSCSTGGADLSLTRDGGSSWTTRPAPFDTTVRIKVRGDRSAFAIGAKSGGKCAPSIRQASSFDGTFGSAQRTGDTWFRDPRSADSVGLPSGGTGHPCGTGGAVVDLAVVDSGAVALCDDGAVMTSETGSSWKRKASVPGGLAVAQTTGGRVLVAASGIGDCDGIALVDAAKPGDALGCAALKVADVKAGTVAVAVTADSGWIAVGSDTYRSDGSFGTWTKS